MGSPPRVLVVDDHPLFRRGVVALMRNRFEVVGEADSPSVAVQTQQRLHADVVLLDLRLKHKSGLAALGEIQAAYPPARIVVLSMYDEPEFRRAARAAGAHGYVAKSAADTELLRTMGSVLSGELCFGDGEVSPSGPLLAAGPGSRLTEREREVLRLIARGHTNRSIGEELGISTKTVEGYRQRVKDKFGLRTRIDLVRFALEIGLVGTSDLPALED